MVLSVGTITSDGTVSTNYGINYEIYCTMLAILRGCLKCDNFKVEVNTGGVKTFDDVVMSGTIKGGAFNLAAQVKHETTFKWEKMEPYVDKLTKEFDENTSYVYYAIGKVSAKDITKNDFKPVHELPEELKLLTTNIDSIYKKSNLPLYLCVLQHNVIGIQEEVEAAFKAFYGLGIEELYEGQLYREELLLKQQQTCFQKFVTDFYHRFLDHQFLDKTIVSKVLGETILANYFVFPEENNVSMNKTQKTTLKNLINSLKIVVINHSCNSQIAHYIWEVLKAPDSQTLIVEEWRKQSLPIVVKSEDALSDQRILKALNLFNYQVPIIILRFRVFSYTKGQSSVSILDNLGQLEQKKELSLGTEVFHYFKVNVNSLDPKKLHQDSFAKWMVGKDLEVIEALDEKKFVDDAHLEGKEYKGALMKCFGIKDVPIKVIEDIVALGANLDACDVRGASLLHLACAARREDIVEVLLKNGAKPNAVNVDGYSVLHFAHSKQLFEAVKSLLSHGASLDIADVKGDKIIQYVVRGGDVKLIELVKDHGGDLNAVDALGDSLLHIAYKAGNWNAIGCLLKMGININKTDVNGDNIFHKAAFDGHCLNIFKQNVRFIKKEAIMRGDVKGKTPMDIAVNQKRQDFVAFFDTLT